MIQSHYGQISVEEETTSTCFTDLSTPGPTQEVDVGASGCVLVQGGAYLTSTETNQTVVVGLKIDDSDVIDLVALGNNTGGSIAGDHSSATMIENLAPGTHTFTLQYLQSLENSTGRFGSRWLLVSPQ